MADFFIVSRPVCINFICPHCEAAVKIPWEETDAPDYWGDEWPDATCPECGAAVALGDWTYD